MKKALKISAMAIALLLIAGAPFAVSAEVGDAAPGFTLKEVETGKDFVFEEMVKKFPFTLIAFTNSACGACRQEMKLLSKIKEEVGDKINMVAIFTDVAGESGAIRYKQMSKDTFVYLIDQEFKQPPAFGFEFTPGLIVVDKKGKVAYKKGGFSNANAEEMKKEIMALLK